MITSIKRNLTLDSVCNVSLRKRGKNGSVIRNVSEVRSFIEKFNGKAKFVKSKLIGGYTTQTYHLRNQSGSYALRFKVLPKELLELVGDLPPKRPKKRMPPLRGRKLPRPKFVSGGLPSLGKRK